MRKLVKRPQNKRTKICITWLNCGVAHDLDDMALLMPGPKAHCGVMAMTLPAAEIKPCDSRPSILQVTHTAASLNRRLRDQLSTASAT